MFYALTFQDVSCSSDKGECFWFETDTKYVDIFLLKKIETTILDFDVKID